MEDQHTEDVPSRHTAAWLGFATYAVAAAAVMLIIISVMGRNSAGEFWIGLGAAFILNGFITRFLDESWRAWPWQPRGNNPWIQHGLGAAMLFCGLLYHFTQDIFVVGGAYVVAIVLGWGVYVRIYDHLHRHEVEAYRQERAAWEERRREQQVRSRIEYRLRR